MRHFLILTILFVSFSSISYADSLSVARATPDTAVKQETKEFDPGKMIMDHILDRHEWHFFTIKHADGTEFKGTINLPVILFSPSKGVSVFSFGKFEDGTQGYKGYHINDDKSIIADDGSWFLDLSLTKVVIQILLSVVLMLLMFRSIAKKYDTKEVTAPKGLQSAMETVILFIRDNIGRPMFGKKADRYMPYLLSIFFFIWINNMIGLLPGAANVTGNIAITTTLALLTFVLLIFGSKSHYWKHVFLPHGVPYALYPIMVPVEILGVFTKPFALLIRLFANMTAGHLIVLSFVALIFIFGETSTTAGFGVSVFSVAFSVFIYFLEILVALLQAYIFTILSALFISDAVLDKHTLDDHKH